MQRHGRTTDPPHTPRAPDPTRKRLSERECQVALLVADGLKDAIIGRRLDLSPATVNTALASSGMRSHFGVFKALCA